MAQRATEGLHPAAQGLDTLPDADLARCLFEAQGAALASIGSALADIAEGAALMAAALRAGGSLVYAGAGSSALMAAADAMELSGTFGVSTSQVRILMAGGLPTGPEMPGSTEDDTAEAAAAAQGITAGDTVIAVTASGSTPYAMEVARVARERGAAVIGIANNAGAPLFDLCRVSICLPTPPEPVAGSTRLGAGTAQKVALNIMSTMMGVRLGHVHDGMMVNVRADNAKLRARAASMVARIAGIGPEEARRHLQAAGGAVKPSVLLAAGAADVAEAEALLAANDGHLRSAMAQL